MRIGVLATEVEELASIPAAGNTASGALARTNAACSKKRSTRGCTDEKIRSNPSSRKPRTKLRRRASRHRGRKRTEFGSTTTEHGERSAAGQNLQAPAVEGRAGGASSTGILPSGSGALARELPTCTAGKRRAQPERRAEPERRRRCRSGARVPAGATAAHLPHVGRTSWSNPPKSEQGQGGTRSGAEAAPPSSSVRNGRGSWRGRVKLRENSSATRLERSSFPGVEATRCSSEPSWRDERGETSSNCRC